MEPRGMSRRRAALYVRLSREESAQNRGALAMQEAFLRSFAAAQGFAVCGVYCDDGQSGVNFERPAFQKLLRAIERGEVDILLTKDLSRLGRNSARTADLLDEYFPRYGVRYISVGEGIDTEAPSAGTSLITPIANAVNELYARDLSRKIRAGLYTRMQAGRYIGSFAPYGYRKSEQMPGKLVPDPEAAAVVQQIFSLAAGGRSAGEIAARLEAGGVCTPMEYRRTGRCRAEVRVYAWRAETVWRILRNPCYLGQLTQGRTQKLSFKSRQVRKIPPREWHVRAGAHAAIVSPREFAEAAHMRQGRKTTTEGWQNKLRGLCWCAECGARMSSAKSGAVYSLVCGGYKRGGRAACHSHRIPYAVLWEAIWQRVQKACLLSTAEQQALCRRMQRGRADADGTASRTARREVLKVKLAQLYDDKYAGRIEAAVFARLQEAYYKEAERLQAEEKAACVQGAEQEEAALETIRRAMRDPPMRRAFLCRVIRRIEVSQPEEAGEVTVRVFWRAEAPVSTPYIFPGN